MNENNDEESSDHEQLMQELMMGLMTNNIPITVDTMMNAFRVHTLIGGAKSGSMEVVKMVLNQHDLDIDVLNHTGYTALMAAVAGEQFEMVRYLIEEHHASVNFVSRTGITPMIIATIMENFEILEYLIEHGGGVNFSHSGMSSFGLAVININPKFFRLFIESGVDIQFTDEQINSTALGQAIAKNHMDIAMLLIECFDANVNFSLNLPDGKPSNCSPLLVAATLSSPQSHAAVVRLMELGANIFAHSKSFSPLRCAIKQNSVRTAQHLIAASWMTPEEFSDTLVVAMNTNPDFANRLIMEDRSLSPANIYKLLKGMLPSVLVPNHLVEDPMKLEELINSLIHHANFSPDCPEAIDSLIYATVSGSTEGIRMLIKCGVNVNAQNQYGHTPVHHAAMQGRMNSLEYLVLNCKADMYVKDQDGKLAKYYAFYPPAKDFLTVQMKVTPPTKKKTVGTVAQSPTVINANGANSFVSSSDDTVAAILAEASIEPTKPPRKRGRKAKVSTPEK